MFVAGVGIDSASASRRIGSFSLGATSASRLSSLVARILLVCIVRLLPEKTSVVLLVVVVVVAVVSLVVVSLGAVFVAPLPFPLALLATSIVMFEEMLKVGCTERSTDTSWSVSMASTPLMIGSIRNTSPPELSTDVITACELVPCTM